MFSCKACSPADQTTDTVKFDAAIIAKQQQEQAQLEQEQQRRAQEEADQQRLLEMRRAEEEEQQRRAQAVQEEARRRAEAEERRRLEEEQARLEREAQERAAVAAAEAEEAARRAEQARLEQEAAEARKKSVLAYLKAKGFKGGAADPKKSLMSTTYPLHAAAKDGDAHMVEMLLQEGASASQKNSSGKTAAQVAERSNRGTSHAAVLAALGGGAPTGRVGGC